MTSQLFGYRILGFGVAVVGNSPGKTNLKAWWKLEEASGTRVDSHGSNDLTDNNTVTQAAGKVGNSAQFVVANSEYLSIADNADLSAGDIDISGFAWVYMDTKPNNASIMGKQGSAGGYEYHLWYAGGGVDRFQLYISNDGTALNNVKADNLGSPSTATWYFIVWWHDSVLNTINIQINNSSIDSVAHTTGINDGATNFQLGQYVGGSGNSFFNGRIDEAGIYKKIFSSSEKTWLYNSGSGRTYGGL